MCILMQDTSVHDVVQSINTDHARADVLLFDRQLIPGADSQLRVHPLGPVLVEKDT